MTNSDYITTEITTEITTKIKDKVKEQFNNDSWKVLLHHKHDD